MRRVTAAELERGDWLILSDATRVKVMTVIRGRERVVLRIEPPGSHPETHHHPFSVPADTIFVKED